MKYLKYIVYTLLQLQYLPIFLIGLIVYPVLCYPLRRLITKYPTFFKWVILYWFSNSDEDFSDDPEINYINNWYGVYEIYNGDYKGFKELNFFKKFILSYKWGALRNPHYNYQLLFFPKVGEKTNIKEITNIGEGGFWTWRNKVKHGKQFVTWKTRGTEYFRYSFTKPLKKLSPLRVLGYSHINFMAGASTNRYILKLRYFKQ